MRPQTMSDLRDLLRGRGSLQAVIDVADFEPRDAYKNPKADQLKSRQQSILSNIQAINDPKTTQQKLIESLPLSEEAMRAQRMAQFAGEVKAGNASLPTARPTSGAVDFQREGGHRRAPDHLHNTEESEKWGAHFYMTAIAIGFFVLLLGSLLFGHGGPPPPHVIVPPMEIREAMPPVAAPLTTDSADLSPDRRYSFDTTSDGQGHVWDLATKRHILGLGFLDGARLHAARWSPDSKYLLITQCAPDVLTSKVTRHDVRLFRMAPPEQVWRRSITGESGEQTPEWQLSSGTVGIRIAGKMHRFSLD
jgi:hypothetical protein